MAPLNVDNTARLWVDYTVCTVQHSLLCRFGTSSNVAAAMTAVDAVLTAIGSSIYEYTIDGARVAAINSTIALPVAWTGASTYGSGAGALIQTGQYLDFVGRSNDGRRSRVTLFGSTSQTSNGNFRVSAGESANVDAVIAVLQGLAAEFVSIGDILPVWHTYANQGLNSYWQRQNR
jgi:hypothetical protein